MPADTSSMMEPDVDLANAAATLHSTNQTTVDSSVQRIIHC
jgi:hypothetical protein